eukprot:6294601-Alexandrium_andersonii.AAC.1
MPTEPQAACTVGGIQRKGRRERGRDDRALGGVFARKQLACTGATWQHKATPNTDPGNDPMGGCVSVAPKVGSLRPARKRARAV